MKTILFLSLLLAATFLMNAQNNFVVQNESAQVFKSLTDALDAAVDGDTIYLPGGLLPVLVRSQKVWFGSEWGTILHPHKQRALLKLPEILHLAVHVTEPL